MSSIASSSTPKRAKPAATALRSHLAGALTRAEVGREVRLAGWVHRRRDLGGLVFIDLRDRAGLVQVSCNPAWTPPDVMSRAAGLGAETVVLVRGTVELRPEPSRDPSLVSREVEVHVTGIEVVGPAQTPPIPVARKEKEDLPAEELRLRHRVLDLRRPELQRNLILRHRLMQATRRYFDGLGFPGDRDADPHQAHARGRARLPGAQSGAPGRVLRAAPVAPALQAAAHGGGARSLLPDRPLLPGRGPACRPAAGVHPDRHRGVVRGHRGRARLRRGDGGGPVGRGRPDGGAADRAAALRARRWSGTEATSPTFGSASRSSTPPRCFARRTSRSPAAAIAGGGRVRGIRVPGGASLTRKQVDEVEAAAKTLGAAGVLRLKLAGRNPRRRSGQVPRSPTPPRHSGSPRAISASSWRGRTA